MSHLIHQGDSAQLLKSYPDRHFDSIVTDPPYGIEFLGKEWDKNTGAIAIWQECLRVLKPGGHLLAFSAARTYHHLATNIDSVGFEIRDQLMWIYSSGFPKAQDIGKSIHKRQNKERSYTIPNADIAKLIHIAGDLYQHPAGYRVRCLPNTKGSGAHDQYGGNTWAKTYERVVEVDNEWRGWKTALKPAHEPIVMARKPYKGSTTDNVLRHGTGALNIDATRIAYESEADITEYLNNKRGPMERGTGVAGERIGMFESKVGFKTIKRAVSTEQDLPQQGRFPSYVVGEIPAYQKYFYCPKVSRRERHCGFEQDQTGNNHPTVKPVALMRYLIQLVTPPNSTVLDPFCGSGSTGMAARELGHAFVGCDLDPNYVTIANARIQGWLAQHTDPDFDRWFDEQ